MKAASSANEAAFIDRRSRLRWQMKPLSLKTHKILFYQKDLKKHKSLCQ